MSLPKPESWRHIHSLISGSREQFISRLQQQQTIQEQQLARILRQNAHSMFGRRFNFSKIGSYAEFTRAIPLQSYEDLLPFIESQAADSSASVICFQETGGSTRGRKLIPYSARAIRSFQHALLPWMDDLLLARPAIKQGSAYWSISPALQATRTTSGGHPLGLTNDALYFGDELAGHIGATLAVNPAVAASTSIESWQYQTLLSLLQAEDLSFVSVWSPSFLLELFHHATEIPEPLAEDISRRNPARARQVSTAINGGWIDTAMLWPGLDTISCWTDGAASGFVPSLAELFPHSRIQGKGLLATEGVISIPLTGAGAPVLAIDSGFFEFLGGDGNIRLSHELERNESYEVVLTNDSGLYRYRLGDRVQVEGTYHSAPTLRFLGRGDHTSDICGEKLTDAFVAAVLAGIRGFSTLAPVREPAPFYLLVTSDHSADSDNIDHALSRNPQYLYARSIGQLGPVKKVMVPDAMQRYINYRLQTGQQLGDIKPPSLLTDTLALDAVLDTT